jgi:maltose-binding protein MalE
MRETDTRPRINLYCGIEINGMKKQLICALLAVIMLIALFSACAKTETAAGETAAVSTPFSERAGEINLGTPPPEVIYTSEQYIIEGYDSLLGAAYKNSSYYFIAEYTIHTQEIFETHTEIIKTDEIGQITAKKELAVSAFDEDNSNYTDYSVFSKMPDGEILALKTLDNNGITVVSFDEELNETVYFDLDTAIKQSPDDVKAAFADNIVTDVMTDDDRIYLLSHSGVYAFNIETNEFLFCVTNENDILGLRFNGLFLLDGEIAVYTDSKADIGDREIVHEMRFLDPEKGSYDEIYDLSDGVLIGEIFYSDGDNPVILSNGVEIKSVDPKTGETVQIIDLLASGFTIYPEKWLTLTDGFASVNTAYDYETYENFIYITTFKRADPNTIKPRQIINVFTVNYQYDFTEFAAEFNRTNTDYQIQIKSYFDDVDGTVDDRISRLNMDLIAGHAPDILMINEKMPYNSYAAKGLFADLNPLLESDQSFKAELNSAALRAMETDGKLYSIARDFTAFGFAGRKSILGEINTITTEQLTELIRTYPDMDLIGDVDREDFVAGIIGYQLGSFIDKKTGEVTFDSPEFVKLLEVAKALPEESNQNLDNMLFAPCPIMGFTTFTDYRNNYFGEVITLTNFPGAEGLIMMPAAEFAVMDGGNTQGAFEVIKAFINVDQPHFQYLSIKNSQNEAAAAAAQNDLDISDEDVKTTFDAINRLTGVSRNDTALMRIIEEEVSAFFAGSKTAEECAELIQNRASTYVAEMR